MWDSLASLGSLVVPAPREKLPGLSDPEDDENHSPGKKVKISKPQDDFFLPTNMRSGYAVESARLQAMQAKILPYHPVAVMSNSTGQCLPDSENDRRLYVPGLNQSLTRRDIFTHFCVYGDLERVCLKKGVDSLNYAIVLFMRTYSMHLAIAGNPHTIKGHRLLCRKSAEKNSNKVTRPFVPTSPMKTVRDDKSVPQTSAAKPSEKYPNKTPDKSDFKELLVPKKLTPLKNLNTKVKPNLMASNKSMVPRKGDQIFVYPAATLGRTSRWSFNLARSFTTPEEKAALNEGHPNAAKKLLEARAQKNSSSRTKSFHFMKPPTPTKTQEHRNIPTWSPASSTTCSRFLVPLPPSRPRQILVSTQRDTISISKTGPEPVRASKQMNSKAIPEPVRTSKQINSKGNSRRIPFNMPPGLNVEFPEPHLNSYFGPDFTYEHHCYTNVLAYQKTKLYINLEPGEWVRRQGVKEFIDKKYGVDIIKH